MPAHCLLWATGYFEKTKVLIREERFPVGYDEMQHLNRLQVDLKCRPCN